MSARRQPVVATMGYREWVDKAEPHPSSTLMYRAHDGSEVIVRAELLSRTPGSMIELGPWTTKPGSVHLSPEDAAALAVRLARMAEIADQGRKP